MRLGWVWVKYLKLKVKLDWIWVDFLLIWAKFELAISLIKLPKLPKLQP